VVIKELLIFELLIFELLIFDQHHHSQAMAVVSI
jgi:hypothetical protein